MILRNNRPKPKPAKFGSLLIINVYFMKSLKIVLASLFLTAGVIFLSSFSSDFKKDAFLQVCFEYATGLGVGDPTDVADTDNWTAVTTNVTDIQNTTCPQSTYLCVICFNDSQFDGADAAAKKQHALNLLAQYIQSNGLPTEGVAFDVDPNAATRTITVYKRATE